jgi:hypothetical protein
MVIVGMLAGVATPRLYQAAQRIEIAAQRTRLLTDIASLGYRAYASGRPIDLMPVRMGASIPADYPLAVPVGWKIQIVEPIHYVFNGICSGGKITFITPDQEREELQLVPPQCKVADNRAAR